VLGHAPGHHVAGGEFLLLRLVVGHEAVAVGVLEQAAVAPAALGDQDAGGDDGGGVELHRLHVAQAGDAGFQGQGGAHALVDEGVGADAPDAAVAPRGDDRGLRQVGREFAGDQVAHHGAMAAVAVVDQGQGLDPLPHRDGLADDPVGHRVEHGVAGAVGGVAGAPFLGAAEIPGGDEAVGRVLLGKGHALAVDHHLVVAPPDPVPGHAPGRQLPRRLGRHVGEHAGDQLVAAPVGAAHRVLEMDVLVVPLALDAVGQAGLHAALGGDGMGALGRHQGQDQGFQAAPPDADGGALAGQSAADDQRVGVDEVHAITVGADNKSVPPSPKAPVRG
jgi:hypothetical protein